MRIPTALLGAAAAITAAVALSACSPDDSSYDVPSLLIDDARGATMAEVDQHVGPTTVVVAQDISVVFGLTPSYNTTQQGSDQWIVLAACGTDDTVDASSEIQVAVAPASIVDDGVLEKARADGYADDFYCPSDMSS